MTDVRDQIVRWGKWGVINHSKFTYTEGPTRMEGVHKPGVLPWQGDCSAWVTCCYSWSKAPDPNGLNYDGEGYTGTLLSHGKKITLKEALPGDIVVFGPGTGVHAALIVEITPQIICSSMGKPGDPSLVSLRELESLGVATFLRNITQEIQVPTLDPTPTQISNAHLTMLHNPTQVKIAEANGWRVLLWNGFHFIPATAEVPAGVLVYSNIHWNIKR